MNCIKKIAFTLALFLSSIAQYNYAHNITDTDKFISSISINKIEQSFFDSYESNRKNLEIFRFEFQWNSDNLSESIEIKEFVNEKLNISILTTSQTETISPGSLMFRWIIPAKISGGDLNLQAYRTF